MDPAVLFDLPAPDPDPVVAHHPVGTVMRTSIGRWGLATATYDYTEQYRFRLSRIWEDDISRRACWVMLNPSTATENVTDPTVERTLRFARGWGFGASEVVNVYAYRATSPSDMLAQQDPVGDGNDDAIVAAARSADVVIAAWGVHATHLDRGVHVRKLLADAGVALHVLKLTKDGHPGHPLYLPATSQPHPW